MPVPTIIHKGRLKRRLDARYFGEIGIACKLAPVFGFKIELLDLVSVHHNNAGFLRVGGIDKHFLSHVSLMHDRNRRSSGGDPIMRSCLVKAIGRRAAG